MKILNLWILYKEEFVISRIVAEMIQEQLIYFIDVSVGKINKIRPNDLVEEELDCLIIGDTIIEETPSLEVQNWIKEYKEIFEINNKVLKILSGFSDRWSVYCISLNISDPAGERRRLKPAESSSRPPAMLLTRLRKRLYR